MIEHAAMTWLVNALWIVPLIAATTALCARFGGLGPRGRHAAWMGALVLAVSLPAAPAALLPFHRAPAPRADGGALPALGGGLAAASAPAADPLPLLALDHTWTRAILCLAGGVVAIALCRLLLAAQAGGRLVRAARPCDLDPTLRRTLSQRPTRGAHSLPPILESSSIGSPVVVGAVRPAILLPPGFTDLPRNEQRAALLHELAHVARRDYAWNLVCEAVSLPLAWHPAILPIKAGVRRSREAACDALAAEAMASRVSYARCLVSLAARLGERPAPAIAVGLIGKSDLEERLMTLLNPRPDRVSSALRMAGASALAIAVLAPAVLLRVTPAFADEPVVARRLLVTAPVTSVAATPPISPKTSVVAPSKAAAKPVVATVRRLASLDASPTIEPPAPPAPIYGQDIHVHVTEGHYGAVVRHALEQALSAEKTMESDEMRRAMADLRVGQDEMLRADKAKIHAEVGAAMAEVDHARVEQAMEQVRSRLRSPEFHKAMEAAARQAARAAAAAAAEAQTDDGKD